ncbi:ABC transporter permease [Mycetocola reblochoni]|uniref:Transport permease protein n=2 Tax=Mycetocola reblochoni TaxID=331618 RepID=A0A1R4K038_9MICO|nr:ABC transporter permease [Mycetocola reblochoni]RLP70474.1 ABC transporter permease [Mycetocola reblochoni]SJN37831.1 O-antigen export system permease protein [Mycetocola reblochoni REB411]
MTTVDLSEFRTPGRGRGILDVFRWHYLLRLLVRKGTQTRYRNSALGWGWSYVKPAAQFGVYYVVMGIILELHRNIPLFAVYLFSGIVMVNFFNESFSNATKSITDNRALVKKIYLPRELFPIAAVIGAFIHFLPQAAILLVVCLLMGWTPSLIGLAAIVVAIVIVAVTALGLGMFFGALNVAYRDAQNFVEIIQVFSTWSVPVLYTWHMVADKAPEWLFNIYMVNPLAAAVELFHRGMWRPVAERAIATDGGELFAGPANLWLNAGIGLAIAVVFLLAGQAVFRRFERRFAQDL